MRTITHKQITDTVSEAAGQIAFDLPADVLEALQQAVQTESNPRAVEILNMLIENAQIASNDRIPLCQDTGLSVVFVEQGVDAHIASPEDKPGATLEDAINAGIAQAYSKALLRMSIVAEPLQDRPNTQTNTPAVIHHRFVPGDKLTLSVMAKGGGCENKSQFRMFNPTAGKEDICEWIVEVVRTAGANACPPFVVGVGIGGNFEYSCVLSKKSLLRGLQESHSDPFYAQMEADLLTACNKTGVGPQGLGGDTTALAVHIETAPCQIASLPVAVNIECHSHRHKTITL